MGIVYRHTSPSGKSYVGQTKHESWELRAGADPLLAYATSTNFRNAIKKYGWDNFTHEVLESGLTSKAERLERESYWISHFDSQHNGYNMIGRDLDFRSPRAISIDAEECISLYLEGYSLNQVANLLGTHFFEVFEIMKSAGIERRSRGVRPKSLTVVEVKRFVCIICQCEYYPVKKVSYTCSRGCRGIFSQLGIAGNTPIEIIDKRSHPQFFSSISIPKLSNGIGRVGGSKLAMHNRWHRDRAITNPSCEFCSQLPS